MDKQMIEENGKELYNDLSSIMSEEYEKRMLITPSYCANKMLEKGYRKIPEGAVVLTREAYNRLFTKARQSEIKTIDLESIVNAREETAEKFAERVKMAFYYEFDELIPSIMSDKIDEICKEITGEN